MKFSSYEKTAKEYKIGGGGFWTPEPGDNKIRILSGYEVYGNHWVSADNRSYVCIGKDDGCKYCNDENEDVKKISAKFLMWILDRKDGEVKIAQVGYSIIKQLGTLATSEDWVFEETPEYDIVIKKTGEKLKTEYAVTPTPNKKPLTKEEQEQSKEEIKDLKEIIGKMKEKAGGSNENESNKEVNADNTPF